MGNTEEPTRSNLPRRRRFFRWWLLLLLLAAGAYCWVNLDRIVAWAGPEKNQGRITREQPPVPVVAGMVTQKDVAIYLDGLGTVQALNTVTVRVRVDGQLTKVAFTEGQEVKEGDLLAEIDPVPFQATLAQTQATKAQNEAQLANARTNLKRSAQLRSERVISQQEYDTQKTLVDQLEATVAANEAAIQNAKAQLGYTTIVSPINGRIGIRNVDKGNIVHASDANGLIVITELHPISVIFTLPEQNLPEIQQQMRKGPITVFALGRNNGPALDKGTLKVIDNQIDTTTGTIRLKANFPNEDLSLWPGQFVNVRLLLETRKGGIVVPAQVIQRGPEGSFAFVIKPDLTVEIRNVKVAQVQEGEALVESGLHPGERVVVEGQYRLQANSRVSLARPARQLEEPPVTRSKASLP